MGVDHSGTAEPPAALVADLEHRVVRRLVVHAQVLAVVPLGRGELYAGFELADDAAHCAPVARVLDLHELVLHAGPEDAEHDAAARDGVAERADGRASGGFADFELAWRWEVRVSQRAGEVE